MVRKTALALRREKRSVHSTTIAVAPVDFAPSHPTTNLPRFQFALLLESRRRALGENPPPHTMPLAIFNVLDSFATAVDEASCAP
jgi:hypothetical protein